MSLATWLHGIIQGTKSPARDGNTSISESRCESKEPASSAKTPTVEDEVFAEKLLGQAVALVGELEASGIPYAVVGGTAVLMQAKNAGLANFRGTYDIDILVNDQRNFAKLAARRNEIARQAGIDVSSLSDALASAEDESEHENSESLPPEFGLNDEFAIGIDSVISLNGYTLDTLQTERIPVAGKEVTVATCGQLLAMKESTIRLLGAGPAETSRPQDFIDVGTLKRIIGKKELKAKLQNDDSRSKMRGGERNHAFRRDIRADKGNKERRHSR